METVVKALYSASFAIWNSLMSIAMTLFTTSPKTAAGGSPYQVVHQIYTSISDATIPIATCFFVIAIYKTVITTPPEQQGQRFLLDAVRYCIILFIAAHLWEILGYMIEFSDGITRKIGSTAGYQLSMGGDLEAIIDDCLKFPAFELSGEWFQKLLTMLGCSVIFLLGGVVLIFIMVASSLSIISSAFQRILRPLIMLPFAGIAVALGAGGHDIGHSFLQYMKTFFGFLISGAMMIVIIKCGCTLCTNMMSSALTGNGDIMKAVMITVQAAITPIVIAGLVRGTDQVIGRMF